MTADLNLNQIWGLASLQGEGILYGPYSETLFEQVLIKP